MMEVSSGPAVNGHHPPSLTVPKEETKPDLDLLECLEEKVDVARYFSSSFVLCLAFHV
jgi:hypothetical protein